jgi:alkaline phosphatase D
VASGDPRPSGVVLWTKVDPAAAPGGSGELRVAYEIAATPEFTTPLVRGVAVTHPRRDHTVKVAVDEAVLRPFTTYYYRFIVAGTASRTGRFKTLPAPGDRPERIRLGYLSCQDYSNGYYTALAHFAHEDLDYVVHLGDYIYETTHEASFQLAQVRRVRLPSGRDRAQDLADYRYLYRTYKSDPHLQEVHERFAMISVWDDHEFANDGYGAHHTDTGDVTRNYAPQRRQDANQAWAEYTAAGPAFDAGRGPVDSLRIYRSFAFGDLIELVLTDERLYRAGPPCGLGVFDRFLSRGCPDRLDPERTMLGAEQREWFLERVTGSRAVWKMWGNQVMAMQLKFSNAWVRRLFPFLPATDLYFNLDQWDGYPAERARLLGTIQRAGVENFVTITGDMHAFGAGYLKPDFDDPGSPPAGVCLMGSSVTSSTYVEMFTFGLGGLVVPPSSHLTDALVSGNPHLRYFNAAAHGYVVMDVTRDEITATMKAVSGIRSPAARLIQLKEFRVPRGQTRLIDASTGREARQAPSRA